MKDLRSILEASLKDLAMMPEGTPEEMARAEFEEIKKAFCKQSSYEKIKAHPKGFINQLCIKAFNLCKFAGITNPKFDAIKFTIVPPQPNGWNTKKYKLNVCICDWHNPTNIVRISPNNGSDGSSAKEIINDRVKPMFESFETFIEWLKEEVSKKSDLK
jgi:hypothetical protein